MNKVLSLTNTQFLIFDVFAIISLSATIFAATYIGSWIGRRYKIKENKMDEKEIADEIMEFIGNLFDDLGVDLDAQLMIIADIKQRFFDEKV